MVALAAQIEPLLVSGSGALAVGGTALRLASITAVLASPAIMVTLKLPWETLVVAAPVTAFDNMLFNTL
jgi:hypothetical protein